MYRNNLYRWAGLLLVVSLLGCGADPPLKPSDSDPQPGVGRELPPEFQGDARSLVEANNRFCLDFYSQVRGKTGNLFFSAYSMSTALGMVSAGARGGTLEEIVRTLHFPLPMDRLHATFGALQRSLDRGTQAGGYELAIANRVWGQEGMPFVQSFLDVTREHYGAEMQREDFIREAEAARQKINRWVEEQTRDKIKGLFPGGSINESTRFVLANAIYFKGLWAKPFDPEHTFDGSFSVSAAEQVMVPIMSSHDTFTVAGVNGVAMLELPYAGEDLSMLFLLPLRVDGLAELEAGLSLELLEALLADRTEARILVQVPRFRFEAKFDLPRVLAPMGIQSAFMPGAADFSGVNGQRNLFLSAGFHQAFVEVNEEGTEAAAATGFVGGTTSPPPSFIARRPFVFLIRDNVTGSILFMGRVVDPRP